MNQSVRKIIYLIRDIGILIVKLFKFGTVESKLMIGKIRRTFKNYLLPKSIKDKKLSFRKGKCIQCGACCRLGFLCAHYDIENKSCNIYSIRSHSCRIYPLDQKELNDRNLIDKHNKCGYYFVEE